MCAFRIATLSLALIVAAVMTTQAAVKTEENTQMKFGGAIGKMMSMFGGKAADEGITQTIAVKGNRKLVRHDNTGQLIDLDEEKVYEIDFKGKSYRVTTFEEMRQKIREAQEKMQQEMDKMKGNPAATEAPPENQMEFTFSVKESGQRKSIVGYDAKEVILTLAIHEKGKTIEDAGGMVSTTNHWLTPDVPALKEIAEFDLKYYQKLATAVDLQQVQQMMGVMAANPYLKSAMERMKEESAKVEGTPLLTTTSFEMVASKEALAQQQAQAEKEGQSNVDVPIGGDKKSVVGGIFGGIARRAVQKKVEEKPDPNATPGRSVVMTSTHQTMKISPDVSDGDVSIPTGFKEKN